MRRDFDVIIEQDSAGYYVARVPELRGCHTQAKSLDILIKRIQEAIALCLDVQKTTSSKSRFIGVQRVTVDK